MEITVIGFDCGRGVGCFCVSNSRPLDPNKFVWLIPNTKSKQGKFTEYEKSRLNSIGSAATEGFTTYLASKAQAICQLELEKLQVEGQMRELLQHPRYEKYVKVLKNRFPMGAIEQAIVVSQIFPFEQFLNENGNPKRETKRNNTESGKPTRQNNGEREFHACLGMAPHQRSSGQKQGMILQGSTMARSALWCWVRCKIEPRLTYERMVWDKEKGEKANKVMKNHSVLTNDIGDRLREQLNLDKQNISKTQGELIALVSDNELGTELINSLKKVKHGNINLLVRVLEEIASEEKSKRRKTANPQKKIKQGISGALARQARSRAMARVVKLLFKELLAEFRSN
jgi:hypothetical protein